MTGPELREARTVLGRALGLGRPLRIAELGRALRSEAADPGEAVRRMENSERGPTGSTAAAVDAWMLLAEHGVISPDLARAVGRSPPDAADDPR